jgi:hypothetical protein
MSAYALALSDKATEARAHAFALESEMMSKVSDGTVNKLEFPLKHYFADGVYVRALFLPAGSFVVGKIHKHEHLAMILCGDISIVDATGVQRVTGYQLPFVSKPGVKRAVAVHEDTWFLTVHRQRDFDTADEDAIEEAYTASTEEEFRSFAADQLLNSPADIQRIEVSS